MCFFTPPPLPPSALPSPFFTHPLKPPALHGDTEQEGGRLCADGRACSAGCNGSPGAFGWQRTVVEGGPEGDWAELAGVFVNVSGYLPEQQQVVWSPLSSRYRTNLQVPKIWLSAGSCRFKNWRGVVTEEPLFLYSFELVRRRLQVMSDTQRAKRI